MAPTGFCDGSSDQRSKQKEPKIALKDLALRNYKEKPFIWNKQDSRGRPYLSWSQLPVPISQPAPKVLPAQNKNEPMIEMP